MNYEFREALAAFQAECVIASSVRLGGRVAMRMLMQISIPVAAGNKAAQTGAFGARFQKILDDLKPEAAYFTATANGERGGFIVFDLKDTSEIPAIAEPFFLNYDARITLAPVMDAQDLAKAGPGIEKAVREYGKAIAA
jgi:hypothetical protein